MINEATPRVVPITRAATGVDNLVDDAREVFRHQAEAISGLASRLNEGYGRAVEILFGTPGHVVVLGVGKSGLIGQKIAATFASTGTPSFFVHSAEAFHGDLGMVTERDTAVLISCSGETEEVVRLVPHLRRIGTPIIGLVGCLDSSLGRDTDIALDVSVEREVCPNNLAPTNSTLAALAMGDALAVSLIRRRGFQAQDFARFHPGGSLGRRLLTRVKDSMRSNDLPIVSPSASVADSLVTMTQGRLGLVIVMAGDKLVGLMTDGDLRRGIQRHANVLTLDVSEIMTLNPVTIDEETLLADAHQRMQAMKLKALVVVNGRNRVSGVVEVFE